MLQYKSAKYLELDNYKSPKGGHFIYIPMKDQKKIRFAYWKYNGVESDCAGTVLMQQGHNEFIEKYFETIQELIDRKYNVVCFDWRGQGLSDRMINNVNKQYIEDLSIHVDDLVYIINRIIKKNFPGPLIGIGHSMGGHLLLLSQEKIQKEFKTIILSAPMLGFKFEPFLFFLSIIMRIIGRKRNFFPFSRPNMGKETPFKLNDLTSDYFRYKRTQELVRKHPVIRLWGVTNAWVFAVKKSLSKIRKRSWLNQLDIPITIINPLNDKVVCSKKTRNLSLNISNCNLFNIEKCEHEILMENNTLRGEFWEIFDKITDS